MPISELHHPSHHRSWIEVNLKAMEENVRRLRGMVGDGVAIMPSVKADAYGHGAIATSHAVIAAGAERIAVATCEEGEELRAAGIRVPIQILGTSLPEEIARAVAADLIINAHEMDLARLDSLEAMKQRRRAVVHLMIDTGMGRLGILPEEASAVGVAVRQLPNIELEGVCMHFAQADDAEYSREQLNRFRKAIASLEEARVPLDVRHAAASSASILYPEARFQMIRPGAAVYGFLNPGWLQERFQPVPVLSWRCAVVQIKDYPPGHSLGYNRTFTTRRPTRVALLPLGYADGYLREFSNKAEVLIQGRRAPVVGMVSMDYTMVDVTELQDVHVGSEVTLIGKDGGDAVRVEDLARVADTIPYCITTRLGRRPGRCYVRI